MCRIGVAVEELDRMIGSGHEGVMDMIAHDHAGHRHRPRRDALRKRDHVGNDAIAFRREGVTEPAEGGDHLIEDQQDAVLVANCAQPLQITFRRRQDAGRARHRLDNDGSDRRGVMQRNDALELVGFVLAPIRLAAGERLVLAIIRCRQMVDAGQERAEEFAVIDHAADGNAAEADAVIAALAADQPLARGLAANIVISERDFKRGVCRFRSGIAEEDLVEIARREVGDARGRFERRGMRVLEGGREIEFGCLCLDRRDDRLAIMPGIAAPKARRRVEDRAPFRRIIMHVLGARDQPRPLLEGAIGGEWQPKAAQVVRRLRRGAGAQSRVRH